MYAKSKEMRVVNFLKENLPDEEFIHNRSVGSDCTGGHLFPDIRFDRLFFQLIIEVDENKHRGTSYKCEEKRMYNIVAKLGQPCVFIRYNPDSKESSLDTLLQSVRNYLELSDGEKIKPWNNMGLRVDYLFY